MRNHDLVTAGPRGRNRVERLGQCANLIQLDQHGVRDAVGNAFANHVGVRDEHIVAHEHGPVAERLGQRDPAVAVVFRDAIFD